MQVGGSESFAVDVKIEACHVVLLSVTDVAQIRNGQIYWCFFSSFCCTLEITWPRICLLFIETRVSHSGQTYVCPLGVRFSSRFSSGFTTQSCLSDDLGGGLGPLVSWPEWSGRVFGQYVVCTDVRANQEAPYCRCGREVSEFHRSAVVLNRSHKG